MATSVFLATSPQVEGIGGRYFEDCNEGEVVDEIRGVHGVVPRARPRGRAPAWDVSLELIEVMTRSPATVVVVGEVIPPRIRSPI